MRNIEKLTKDLIKWIEDWFNQNGPGCPAVIGISGGKDSTIVAKLCCEALGKDRVVGVMIPQGEQKDIEDSKRVCEILGIKPITVNIGEPVESIRKAVEDGSNFKRQLNKQALVNLPARMRMVTLYAISQTYGGRVSNNCNRSENCMGYATIFGDAAGDFSPLHNLTVTEVIEIGDYLGLPYDLVHKTPMDGLNLNPDGSYVTDEQNLGITYAEIDDYLLNGGRGLSGEVYNKIRIRELANEFKLKPMAAFVPSED